MLWWGGVKGVLASPQKTTFREKSRGSENGTLPNQGASAKENSGRALQLDHLCLL